MRSSHVVDIDAAARMQQRERRFMSPSRVHLPAAASNLLVTCVSPRCMQPHAHAYSLATTPPRPPHVHPTRAPGAYYKGAGCACVTASLLRASRGTFLATCQAPCGVADPQTLAGNTLCFRRYARLSHVSVWWCGCGMGLCVVSAWNFGLSDSF
jgi:hypothetical protein